MARLRKKKEEELENIHQVFNRFVCAIPLEDLIIYDFSKTFAQILEKGEYEPLSVLDTDDIKKVVKMFEDYDLSIIAVVDRGGKLVGLITSDDIYDLIEEHATEQIYNLAGVSEEAEYEQNIKVIFKKRALWLLVNLGTAFLASFVIGFFDKTIEAYVALAVLMSIVASMGGNARTQALSVVVRQLALGEIEFENAKQTIKKEVTIALLNGSLFSLIVGAIAYSWFHEEMLGVVIALAMVINLFAAGFFGAFIPLILRRMQVDPAVGSSVLLTTVTDVVGFFSFLGLATLLL